MNPTTRRPLAAARDARPGPPPQPAAASTTRPPQTAPHERRAKAQGEAKAPSAAAQRPPTMTCKTTAAAAEAQGAASAKKQRRPERAGRSDVEVFDEAAATRDAKKLNVADVRAALEAAGADTEGLKAELVERLVAARRAAFYAPPPPPSDSDSDSDTGVDIAAEEATKEKLLALLAECDDDDVPAAPAPRPRSSAAAGGRRPEAARAGAGRRDLGLRGAGRRGGPSALGATLASALDGMVRTGDLSREQAAAVLREYGRLAPAGAPLDRRRVKDRLVGKIEQMFAEAPRTSKKEKSALARLEREAQYVEEGPRLADYGIDGASGLELGNPLGLED